MNIGGKYEIPLSHLERIEQLITQLRRNDIISSSLFARRTGLDIKLAKKVLGDLVASRHLEYFIIAPCTNPLEEAEHYSTFHSLDELNSVMLEGKCPICEECGSSVDIKRAKVGYKRKF